MNSLGLKQNLFWQRFQILTKTRFLVKKSFSKETKDDAPIPNEDEKLKVQKGILHDKQQSLHEESYFHKEEREQLKSLKQKLKSSQGEKSGKEDTK